MSTEQSTDLAISDQVIQALSRSKVRKPKSDASKIREKARRIVLKYGGKWGIKSYPANAHSCVLAKAFEVNGIPEVTHQRALREGSGIYKAMSKSERQILTTFILLFDCGYYLDLVVSSRVLKASVVYGHHKHDQDFTKYSLQRERKNRDYK